MKKLALLLISAIGSYTQGLDPKLLLNPPPGTWPTFNGDYSGRRYSPLSGINRDNVDSLALAWAFQTRQATVKSTPLVVNGVLYFTVPDHVWAVDARTGRQIWHYARPSEGDHVGHRGVALYGNRLYFGTPDAHLICLDARNGEKLWDVTVADVAFDYYISAAPLVVKDKLIVGISGDGTDVPGFLEARDPNTGKLLWKWDALPKPGEPGSETWPDAESMSRGGGMTWVTGSYDPELNLIYWGTGNPHPVRAGNARAGANLYTCSLVALNPDTGKLVWYIQTSPHDTHDRDSNQTPVLIDGEFHGAPRKMLGFASRSGYYFLLDRATGECLLSLPYGPQNWSDGVNKRGEPIPKKDDGPPADGRLFEGTTTNWFAPSYDPDTKLFYVNASHGFAVDYLTREADNTANHQGGGSSGLWSESMLLAIDYQTGHIRWAHKQPGLGSGGTGVLTTAGGLLFSGESGKVVALDAADGTMLWGVNAGAPLSGSPMTYELNGRQYVITAAGNVLYAWALPAKSSSYKSAER